MDLTPFSCVITTVPITFDISIPIIQVSPFMDEKSMHKIGSFIQKNYGSDSSDDVYKEELLFFNQDLKTKQDVLQYIVEQIHFHYPDETITFQDLMKREELSSTEVGNQCCMPHPIDDYPKRPIVIVIILKRSIKWFNHKVKYVFYVSLPKEYAMKDQIIDEVTSLVCDNEKLMKLSQNFSFENFLDMIRA